MKLRNILITVNDIDKSITFYHVLFGLDVLLHNNGKVILTEGLVLQDASVWKETLKKDIILQNNAAELYFEETNIEAFAAKLEELYPNLHHVSPLTTHSWGQKIMRFYDPDGTLIEVGTPM